MAVLAFRHVPFEPLGMIADVLDSRGIEWRYVDLWDSNSRDSNSRDSNSRDSGEGEDLAVELAQALVVMGGPMSVNDSLPWLRHEERYLVRAMSSGVPILGVCLGAQLLAKCLGARVRPMGHKEIGWYPVRFTEDGRRDPLFQGLEAEETTFHWHGDTFDLPDGSVKLAESDLCANQAFRSGSGLYGVQFHPEVTPDIIASWCRDDAGCGDLREAEGTIDPEAHQQRMREVSAHIFGRWCDLVATR